MNAVDECEGTDFVSQISDFKAEFSEAEVAELEAISLANYAQKRAYREPCEPMTADRITMEALTIIESEVVGVPGAAQVTVKGSGDTLITLQMIAREFLLLTGPGEATAMFCFVPFSDNDALVIRKDGVIVVGQEFDKRALALSMNDFSARELVPLAEAWRIRREAGPSSPQDVAGVDAMAGAFATARLADD